MYTLLKKTFRLWWQKPRRTADLTQDRRVSFLELFYDLVYVIIISQLGHALSANFTWIGAVGFVFLFVIVWWAWINGSLYHELHGNNDIRTRVFTFLQMFSVIAMATFAYNALGEGRIGFAISFAAFELILTYLWWRTGVHDPVHRPLSQPYSLAFLLITILFFASAFVTRINAFFIWATAVTGSLLLPFIIRTIVRKDAESTKEFERSLYVRPSFVERFDLFIIIVLGEVIIGVVQGIAQNSFLSWSVARIAAVGMLIAVGMWWLYFDFVSARSPIQKQARRFAWIYLHLPVAMAIAMTGAGVLNAIQHAGGILPLETRWLLIISVVIFLVSIILLIPCLQIKEANKSIYSGGRKVMAMSVLLMVFFGFFKLRAIWLLVIIALLLLAPIFVAFKLWIKRLQTAKR